MPPKRRPEGRRNTATSAADWLTSSRLLIAFVLWPVAVAGQARIVGVGLIAAGLTDVLDGHLARRTGRQSAHGERFDSVADTTLMLSAAVWIGLLHPQIASENWQILTASVVLYVLSMIAGGADPKQASGKVAGGLLYLFALFTLLTGVYSAALLDVALVALTASSLETIFKATKTIHSRARARIARSHRPHASNEVVTNTAAAANITTSATPSPTETRP